MSNAGLTEAECREIAEETALQKHAADLKAEHMRATMIYDDQGWRRTECIRFVKRTVSHPTYSPPAVRQVRILQQLWVNPRLPDGENKQWRDVEEVEEE